MKIQPRIEQGGVTLLFSTAEEAAEIYRLLSPLFNGSNVETKPVQATTPAPQPPEPQPVASVETAPVEILHLDGGKMPKTKKRRRQRAFLPETVLFFRELETARKGYNKERDRATTPFLSLVFAFRHFRFYARRWHIKLTPPVRQEIAAWLKKGIKDCSVRRCVRATISDFNNQQRN